MRKKVIGTILTLVSLSVYFVFFSITYEVLVPYYYEDYLNLIFLIGVCLIFIAPFMVFKFGVMLGRKLSFFRSIVITNSAVVVLFCSTLAYLYQGTPGIQTDEEHYYKVVPNE